MNIVLGKLVRYLIIAAVGGFLTKLVEKGLLTQINADQWVDASVLLLIAAGTFAYTSWLKPWWEKRKTK